MVAWPAGGTLDVVARHLGAIMEKNMGVILQVVNKPGAGGQLGTTEMLRSKPDGYTIGFTPLPIAITFYLDPDRQAVFGRKDIQPLAMHHIDPCVVAVKADSPYKTMKDLIEAAKANPEKIKVSDTGILSDDHLAIMQLNKITGAKFATVHFDGGAASRTALLGGHIDVEIENAAGFVPHVKSGAVRILGVMDTKESKFLPGVKTLESQGYTVYMSSARSISMPAGAPKEVVNVLSGAIKKAMDSDQHLKRLEELGLEPRYMGPEELAKFWDDMERDVEPLVKEAKTK